MFISKAKVQKSFSKVGLFNNPKGSLKDNLVERLEYFIRYDRHTDVVCLVLLFCVVISPFTSLYEAKKYDDQKQRQVEVENYWNEQR